MLRIIIYRMEWWHKVIRGYSTKRKSRFIIIIFATEADKDFFFIFLIESTWDPDMKIIKKFSISNFLHCILAIQKCEISLLVGSQTVKTRTLTFKITFRWLWTKDLPKYLRGKRLSRNVRSQFSVLFAFSLRTFLF